MKKHFLSVALLCGTVIFTSSCKKDEIAEPTPTVNTPETPAPVSNAFFAKVDGAEFMENFLSVSNANGTLLITASISAQAKAISVAIPATATPGTYTTSNFGNNRIQYNSGGSSMNNIYTANPGSITVTSNDQTNKVIKGTFTGTMTPGPGSSATDSHSITEGSFTMNY